MLKLKRTYTCLFGLLLIIIIITSLLVYRLHDISEGELDHSYRLGRSKPVRNHYEGIGSQSTELKTVKNTTNVPSIMNEQESTRSQLGPLIDAAIVQKLMAKSDTLVKGKSISIYLCVRICICICIYL
jgi:hypothetical protein